MVDMLRKILEEQDGAQQSSSCADVVVVLVPLCSEPAALLRSAARLPSLLAVMHPTTLERVFFVPSWWDFVITRVLFCPLTMECYACQAPQETTTADHP
jgi:hypothetical protein